MMPNNISIFLDIALSLIFFYFLTSMFVSGIVEFIHTLIEKRAAFFQKAIEKLRDSPIDSPNSFWLKLKNNSFVKNLDDETDKNWKLWGRKMSYLDSTTFVSAIINMLGDVKLDENQTIGEGFEKIKKQIEAFDAGTFQQILKTIAQESTSLEIFELKLANWFNQYMEHVSGWFKRYSRLTVMLTSVVVTIALNLNTVVITKQLASNKALRDAIVSKAIKYVDDTKLNLKDTTTIFKNDADFKTFVKNNYADLYTRLNKVSKDPSLKQTYFRGVDTLTYREATSKYLESKIESLGFNIGYQFSEKSCCVVIKEAFYQNNMNVWLTIIGWTLTVAALSFGAPFWFDLLVKLVNVRNVMKKPSKDDN
jgi:hypothetical protein